MDTQKNFIEEGMLAKRLGLRRGRLARSRPEAAMSKDRLIFWPIKAAHRLAKQLGLPWPEIADADRQTMIEKRAWEVLAVHSAPALPNGCHFAQRWLIKARRPNGEIVVVRVLDSSKYLPRLHGKAVPMTFKAQRAPAGNWWLLAPGVREPRWKGIW